MLEVRKEHWLSSRHEVSQDGTRVAGLLRSHWRSRAEISINGRIFQARKQGVFRSTYALTEDDSLVMEVQRPSSWRSKLVFESQGRRFEMSNRNWYRSALVVKSDGAEIGGIHAKGFWTTRLFIDLPATLPLHVRVFLGWIALELRDEAAAVAGAAT